MNLTHLRYIQEIAKTGSITRAAQNLYMGQPNLSKAVRDMEKAMGTAIFKRTAKGVEPTKKGRELIEKATALLAQADSFEEYFFGKKNENRRLWIASAGAEYYFSEFQRTVLSHNTHKESENYSFGFLNCSRREALEMVAEGEADYAVIRSYEDKAKFSAKVREKGLTPKLISEGHIQIAVNDRDFLSSKESIEEKDLEDYTEILTFGSNDVQRKKTVTLSCAEYGCKLLVQLKNSFMRVSSLDVDCLQKGINVIDFLPEKYCFDWIVSVGE